MSWSKWFSCFKSSSTPVEKIKPTANTVVATKANSSLPVATLKEKEILPGSIHPVHHRTITPPEKNPSLIQASSSSHFSLSDMSAVAADMFSASPVLAPLSPVTEEKTPDVSPSEQNSTEKTIHRRHCSFAKEDIENYAARSKMHTSH